MSDKYITVETNCQFSKSCLWDIQKQYFIEQGINAWNGQVPFYITSNPVVANTYINTVLRFLQDQIKAQKLDTQEPIYIMELGTGPGQLSFYCLQRLQQFRQQLGLEHLDIRYVMTDFTESNLDFWQQHPRFQPFLESGQLDFAIFDLESTQNITLENSQQVLEPKSLKNPLIVFANYIFDTVSHDIFHVEPGKIQEALISVNCTEDNLEDNKPIKLKNIQTSCTYHDINPEQYYEDADLNAILAEYPKRVNKGSFLFPLGSFTGIKALKALSQQALLLIATDKGYIGTSEIENRVDPSIICHGSLSMSVNFDAIAQYFNQTGGSARHQTIRDSIRTCIYLSEGQLDDLPETTFAIEQYTESFSIGDYFNLHRYFREHDNTDAKTLLSVMALNRWDPYVLSALIDRLSREIPKASHIIKKGFIEGLVHKLAPQIYLLPGSDDYEFHAGLLLHYLEAHEEAIPFYQRSLAHRGDYFSAYYNIGLCQHMLGNNDDALVHLERAVELEQETTKAKDWIAKIKAG